MRFAGRLQRFARRYKEVVVGIELWMTRPEDTILTKLRWSVMSGGSEKQFTDALRVYEVQHGTLDLAYLERWAKELDLQDEWNRLKSQAETA